MKLIHFLVNLILFLKLYFEKFTLRYMYSMETMDTMVAPPPQWLNICYKYR